MNGVPAAGAGGTAPGELRARLERLATGFQAVFLSKMFQAMRETAVRSSLVDPSPGEQTFRYLLDETLASEAAARMRRGIGDDIYSALCRRLPEGAALEEGGQE